MSAMLTLTPDTITESTDRIGWESRHDGALLVATIGTGSVAGISGPWSDGSYALTWWSAQHFAVLPTLEFHGSMKAAKERVTRLASQSGRMAFITGKQPH